MTMQGGRSATANNGRDPKTGAFVKGNKGGPGGRPQALKRAKWQIALAAAVSVDDIMEVMSKVVELAKRGDMRAVKELFDRTVGSPAEQEALERIEYLERLAGLQGDEEQEETANAA